MKFIGSYYHSLHVYLSFDYNFRNTDILIFCTRVPFFFQGGGVNSHLKLFFTLVFRENGREGGRKGKRER